MSWLNDLYLTYEACESEIGVVRDNAPVLLPIAHLTQNAQIEIVLNQKGEFLRAEKIDKSKAVTVIPVTEDSGSRAGTAAFPHPLADKLEYIAGDYGQYAKKYNPEKFRRYVEQLEAWAESEYSVLEVQCVMTYVKRQAIVHDLIQSGLAVVENGILSGEKIQGIAPLDWFVRFSVEIPGKAESRLYCSKEIFDSYIGYYLSLQEIKDLCYATGQVVPCSEKHPAKIRNTADKAKLISANDASGFFTYKGRFQESRQVAMVSYEVSQKAHNALRWLLAKQASYKAGEQMVLIWSIQNQNLKSPFSEFNFDMEEVESFTDEQYARQVRQAIWGSEREITPSDDVIVMGVEAATTGRLSIIFYQKYQAKDFIERVVEWKQDVCWMKKRGKDYEPAPWSPSLFEIVKQAVGDKNDKLTKTTRERILPCIVEGRKLSRDIVTNVVQAAINRPHYKEYLDWSNAVITACAVLRKYQIQTGKKEESSMALDNNNTDRSYLFGRLIATAEMLERYATQNEKGEATRNTAAEKYFVRFQRYPVQTWQIIRNQLQPYIFKLKKSGKKSNYYVEELDKIVCAIPDITDNNRLDARFLQGYSCQMVEYRNYIKKANTVNKEEEANE